MIWQNLDILNPDQAARIDAYLDSGGHPRQVVRIYWKSGARNYTFLPFAEPDEVDCGFAVEARLRADNIKTPFLRIKQTAAIAPDVVNVTFNDQDKAIRKLMRTGENARAEVFLYYPKINELVSEFVGQVKRVKRQRGPIYRLDIQAGVRPNLYPATTQAIFETGCQAAYGGYFNSWEQIKRNPCRVNIHLPELPPGVERIGRLNPDTGLPYVSCPRTSRGVCDQVSGKPEMFFGGPEITDVTTVGSGNRTTLAKAFNVQGDLSVKLGVLFGYRRSIPLTLRHFVRQSPGSSSGSLVTIFWASAGPIGNFVRLTLRGKAPQGSNQFLGSWAQPTTAYVRQQMGQDVGNFSNVAYVLMVENPVNPATIKKEDMTGEAEMLGYAAVRQFNADGTYFEGYTETSSWCFLEWLTSTQFGLGLPLSDFVINDWIKLAQWDAELVQALTPDGTPLTATRNRFNEFVVNRKAEEVIKDWCLSMRYILTVHGGKLRVFGLDRWDLTSVPLFRVGDGETYGGDVLAVEGGELKGTADIEPLEKSADEIPLILRIKFDDDEKGVPGRPLSFVDDVAIRTARDNGQDIGWQIPEKPYSLYGITNYPQAVRASNFLLNLGEFDTGGTRNNFGAKLVVNGARAKVQNLHIGAVIELDWPEYADETEPENGEPIRYFRVIEKVRREDMRTELTVWAYPKRYYEQYGGTAVQAEAPPPTPGADAIVLETEIA